MKKLLWHKRTERPKFNEIVTIIFFTNDDEIRIADFAEGQDWKIFCMERGIKKWCYISELKQDNIFLDDEEEKKIQFEGKDIEFVRYTGKFPNLCRGTLFVRIDGMMVSFNDAQRSMYPGITYPAFWESGGSFDNDWNPIQKPWKLVNKRAQKRFPEEIRKLLPELLKIFNEKVPYGCCGGCA